VKFSTAEEAFGIAKGLLDGATKTAKEAQKAGRKTLNVVKPQLKAITSMSSVRP
jgi:hypothetical protein